MSEVPLHVYGYIGDAAPLPASAREVIAAADLVVGGRRHLDALGVAEEVRVVLGRLDPAIEALVQRGSRRAVVVASGDPGFFGIVRRLRAAGLDLVVEPGPSACALAFGRLGMPWEDGQIVSAHGRDLRRALNVIRAHDLVAVMTDVGSGLREIAAALGPWPRELVLLEHLGEHDERVRRCTLEEALALDPADILEPNVVVALATADAQASPTSPWSGPGMPWRLGDRGRHVRAAELRADPVSALVMGAFGAGPGDLVAVLGEDTDLVAAAAAERGAAVGRFAPSGGVQGSQGMPLADEPDLVCVSAAGEWLSEILDAVAGTWDTVRTLAVVTDEAGVHLAEACLARTAHDADFACRMIPLPGPVDLRRVPCGTWAPTGRYLLLADRCADSPDAESPGAAIDLGAAALLADGLGR